MRFIVLCAVATTVSSMVADVDTVPKKPVADPVCQSCCYDYFHNLWPSWKATALAGLGNDTYYEEFHAWNQARMKDFTSCGAVTTASVIYLREFEVFMSWGTALGKVSAPEFCGKSCTPPLPGKLHVTRSLFQANVAAFAKAGAQASKDVIQDAAVLLKSAGALANGTDVETEDVGLACNSGCFDAKHYVAGFGAEGSFCADSTQATMSICKKTWLTPISVGTCSGMTITPANVSTMAKSTLISVSGGAGPGCPAQNFIKKIVCEPTGAFRVYLKVDQSITVTTGQKCLLEQFADNMDMSIDEALEHDVHGPHAENLLVDCYRHALRKGVSLVEKSRQEAAHLTYQLEDRHEEQAVALFNLLPEKDKKHHAIPAGVELTFEEYMQ